MHARKEGKISELILDCWENEPDINRELLELATIATPHIAGFSADGKANGTRMCLKNIEKFFQVKIEKISEVIPPAPETPVIDLNRFDRNRIEQAILTSFNPLAIDRALRENPDRFECSGQTIITQENTVHTQSSMRPRKKPDSSEDWGSESNNNTNKMKQWQKTNLYHPASAIS